MAITRGQLDLIAKRRERAVYNAFVHVIQSIRDQATIQEIVRALEIGNVNRVIDLLQLDQATYEPLENEILQSFRHGGFTGAAQVGKIPMHEGELVARFNVRAPAAEAWAATKSSDLVTEIIEPQAESLRDVIRDGINRGINPRQMAYDIVGRVSSTTGRREGGFIGLTRNQQQWIYDARNELMSKSESYFGRKLRDKRFDGAIRKYFDEGKKPPTDLINNAITAMQNRAEKYRAQVIARTEALNALRSGQQQAVNQAYEQSDVIDKEIKRVWSDTGGDGRTRKTHRKADGQEVVGISDPFIVGGDKMMFPGDTSLGASKQETVQCRCSVYNRISWGARAARIEGFR